MNEKAITDWMFEHLVEVDVAESSNNFFFLYKPLTEQADQKMPFATLMTNDDNDAISNLSRARVFRLNIGVRHETYQSMFGKQPKPQTTGTGVIDLDYDFTALDRLMPHPVYAYMSWICVLNPTPETFEKIKPLLLEAHTIAKRRNANR